MQSRISSLIESALNTASGFALSIVIGIYVYPLFGHSFSVSQLGGITLIFTLVSVARNYVWRRLFNRQEDE